MKAILKKQNEEFKKSTELRKLSSASTSYKDSIYIQKEQNKAYNKWLFFKNLNEAMNKLESK